MKKAKSRSKKAVKNQNARGTITLQKYNFETLSELSKGVQDKFYRMHFGTTLQLVNQYNDLARNLHFLAPSNRVVIVDALDLIEKSIDSKISRMNDYLSQELDHARALIERKSKKKSVKPSKKNPSKRRKGKSTSKRAKAMRAMRANESFAARSKRLSKQRASLAKWKKSQGKK